MIALTSEAVGARLKELRKEAKVTQVDLARMLGVCQSSIQKIEGGKLSSKVEYIQMYCDVLGVLPQEFLDVTVGDVALRNSATAKRAKALRPQPVRGGDAEAGHLAPAPRRVRGDLPASRRGMAHAGT